MISVGAAVVVVSAAVVVVSPSDVVPAVVVAAVVVAPVVVAAVVVVVVVPWQATRPVSKAQTSRSIMNLFIKTLLIISVLYPRSGAESRDLDYLFTDRLLIDQCITD